MRLLRLQVKPFVKVCNYTHLMPTRYALEVELKSVVTTDIVTNQANPTARQNARKEVKKILEEKYNNSLKTGKNKVRYRAPHLARTRCSNLDQTRARARTLPRLRAVHPPSQHSLSLSLTHPSTLALPSPCPLQWFFQKLRF